MVEHLRQMLAEDTQVDRITGAGLQFDIEVALGLWDGIDVALVHVEREYRGGVLKAGGRPVALVDIQIDDERPSDQPLGLERSNGNRHVGIDAEPFAGIGFGVMESAAEVDADSVLKRQASGEERASGCIPKRFNHPEVKQLRRDDSQRRRLQVTGHLADH